MVSLVESWKKEDEEFVGRESTVNIEEATESFNVITITGSSGSGKSSNMHHMALKLHKDGYWVYPVQEFEEITKEFYDKDTNKKQVFTLDDPFGVNQLKNNKFDDFRRLNDMLKACLKDKSKKLFMTVRTEIYKELPNSTIVSVNEVNVENRNESPGQREDFLREMITKTRDNAPDEHIMELARKCDVPFFPLICRLYIKDEKHKGSDVVWVNSASVLKDRFKEMLYENQSRFCALAMCLVYSGERIPLTGIAEFSDDEKIEHEKLQMRILSFNKKMDIDDFEKQLILLSGVYVEENNEIYKFRHDIFRNIVAYVLAEEKKRFFMEHCDMELCLEIFTFGLPTINDRTCLKSDIRRAKAISVGRQHSFDKSSNTLDKKDSLHLEKSLLDLLATKCVKKLIVSTEDKTFSQIVRTIINSVFLQNAYFLRIFHSKVENSNMDCAQIDMIRHELFVSACLSLEAGAIEDIFPDLSPYKSQQDNKITDVTPLLACAYSSKIDTMKQLVQTQDRYKVEVRSQRPITPLCLSVFKSNYKSVEFLLENHADVNYGNPTPFRLAFEQNSLEIADLLISKGADINEKYRCDKATYFTTPLCWACENGYNERVKYLIDHKADVNKCDGLGNSPLTNAVNSNCLEIVQMLLKHETIDLNICGEGENARTPLCSACSNGNKNLVERLVCCKVDVNKCDGNANSPLINAVMGNHRDIVEYFLDLEVRVNCNQVNWDGNTALTCSIWNSDLEITECLLKFENVDLNFCGEGQNADTPLCVACSWGNFEIVEKLIEYGADVNKCNRNGDSPLKIAETLKDNKIIEVLLKNSKATRK